MQGWTNPDYGTPLGLADEVGGSRGDDPGETPDLLPSVDVGLVGEQRILQVG